MKKLIPILLIILISLNTFGFDFILGYLLFTCKLDFKEHVENNSIKKDLVVFKMSQIDSNKFQKFDDEIKYDGRMYDIVKEEKNDNDIYFYCYSDEKEDGINKIINEQNDKQNHPSKVNYLQKNLAKNYLSPENIDSNSKSNYSHTLRLEHFNITSHFSEILSPPPNNKI